MDYDYHNISFYVMCCNEMQTTWKETEALKRETSYSNTKSRKRENLMMITCLLE